ncbi:hypothetical protein, partial [Stenotrophomonas maltophilia]|uniref:hypothetical protein n=1 Tax=Stenotrophomonas maltophilia TaxID=40324 RepID=UPI0034521E34
GHWFLVLVFVLLYVFFFGLVGFIMLNVLLFNFLVLLGFFFFFWWVLLGWWGWFLVGGGGAVVVCYGPILSVLFFGAALYFP